MLYNNLQREHYLRKISKLENDLDMRFNDLDHKKKRDTDNNCSLAKAVIDIHKCSFILHNKMSNSLKSFNDCIIKTNNFNDVLECVKEKENSLNKINVSSLCQINNECKFRIYSLSPVVNPHYSINLIVVYELP